MIIIPSSISDDNDERGLTSLIILLLKFKAVSFENLLSILTLKLIVMMIIIMIITITMINNNDNNNNNHDDDTFLYSYYSY